VLLCSAIKPQVFLIRISDYFQRCYRLYLLVIPIKKLRYGSAVQIPRVDDDSATASLIAGGFGAVGLGSAGPETELRAFSAIYYLRTHYPTHPNSYLAVIRNFVNAASNTETTPGLLPRASAQAHYPAIYSIERSSPSRVPSARVAPPRGQ
jgi:hypothetical protein